MRILIFASGILMTALGFVGMSALGDPGLFQGALTLGGGWIICGLFSLSSRWHGILGAGILALLGAARCAPALPRIGQGGAETLQAVAFVVCTVVLVAVIRAARAERARQSREALENDGE
jgi:membrane protein implicated in regulation of membrane protease activity